jgi:hypothetical protein
MGSLERSYARDGHDRGLKAIGAHKTNIYCVTAIVVPTYLSSIIFTFAALGHK